MPAAATRQDRARAVIAGLDALIGDFPEEALALWAITADLRVITGTTADRIAGPVLQAS